VLTARDLTRRDRERLEGTQQVLRKGEISLKSLVGDVHAIIDAAKQDDVKNQ
jgi:hypothetical protein